MADPRLLFLLDAKNLASKEFAKVQKDLGGIQGSAVKAGGGIGSYATALGGSRLAMIGVAGVIGGVILGLKGAAEAAIEEEKNVAKLDAALKANIPGWDGNRDAIERRIVAGEKLAFSDDAQRASLALLVGSTHDVTKAQDLQSTAMDLARLKGIGLEEASTALIKVEGGQFRALKALGIQLRDGATATEALAAVQKVAGGQAAAYANTAGGAMESLGLVIGDLQEDIGGILLPVIKELAIWLRDEVVPAVRDTGKAVGPVIDFIADFDINIRDLVGSLGLLKLGLGPLIPLFAWLGYESDKAGVALSGAKTAADFTRDSLENPWKIGPFDLSGLVGFQTESEKTTAQALATSQAMLELGQTPEAIAADLSESHAIMNKAAFTGITQPLVAQTKSAQTQVKAIARATPFEIAKSLREGSDPVKVAAELLKDAIKNSLTPAKEIAGLEGELTGSELAKRLQSKRPEVVAAAQAWKAAIEERLYALRNGVPQIALDTGQVYGDALQSKKDAIGRHAALALTGARTAFKDMQADAGTWGTNTGAAFDAGIAGGIRHNMYLVKAALAGMQKLLLASSPPGPESPLHKIDVWGERTGAAWTEGMVGGIDASAVRRAMAGVGSETMSGGASAFGQSVSGAARSGGGFGPGGVPVSIPIYLDGRQIAEVVDEHLYYARAAAAR